MLGVPPRFEPGGGRTPCLGPRVDELGVTRAGDHGEVDPIPRGAGGLRVLDALLEGDPVVAVAVDEELGHAEGEARAGRRLPVALRPLLRGAAEELVDGALASLPGPAVIRASMNV
jgi:hypothetical protein